ncbi:MAG: metalloregulator ArsR/SmtB family transcription factor [Firmicutes bacterium]|jgi:ArsR family transcriptional regulator|uniref:Transcriptional regulator n=1 Tax=Sulfobacillus benefaciens TaxID=453960 RepID=A0A2T2X7C2_9FIRM|nr:metalloregulator ArsR/SmtB family transcription factor [Bacillota bacterium]MCL5012592.1 metalloregulator ArsR/SmtB family transcription factor [Bacillota bacterium]PSR30375.1 MAG: transcriptional regulator [Sulfobacillus benefaciens]HBQ95507.1 transcriptional regulator [Sulfobacillus sp.]
MTTEETSALFKALGDQTRLRILALLSLREHCNCELVSIFGISQPAVSRHIARLKESRLIHERRQGQWVYYSLNRALWEQLPSFPHMVEDLVAHDPLVRHAKTTVAQCSLPGE